MTTPASITSASPPTASTAARAAVRRPAPVWLALLTVAVFLWLDTFHLDLFRQVAGAWTGYPRLAALAVLAYGPQLLVTLGLAAALFGPRAAAAALGLGRAPGRALLLGLACTAPMALGLALHAPPALGPDTLPALVRSALLPGFGEELLYRGFLFGLLFRYAGWGFLPAALLAALLFGGAHLYQGGDPGEAAGIFALTALGSLWFAWLYVEWDYDLWVPVALHVLMNAWWTLFPVADNALGPLWTVGLRLVVMALSIGVTLAFVRRRGGRTVQGRRWWRGGRPSRAPASAGGADDAAG